MQDKITENIELGWPLYGNPSSEHKSCHFEHLRSCEFPPGNMTVHSTSKLNDSSPLSAYSVEEKLLFMPKRFILLHWMQIHILWFIKKNRAVDFKPDLNMKVKNKADMVVFLIVSKAY